ncbi:MAG: phosphoribosylformylglycinamidine cyclo-ligase [Pseudomonadota bacterium]
MSEAEGERGLTYRDAGVDIDAGNALVERIGQQVARTRRDGVLTGLGGFGGLFALDLARFPEPVLVSGTDGVGTKLLLARELDRHDSIGIDLVAMCVNDIVVTGAEPLFFLDYYATGELDVSAAADVIGGIATGCEHAGCALIGGETAEMPGMYAGSDYDLAGFAVGAVSRPSIIDGSGVNAGDRVLGLAASGPHSNGYSLIRAVRDRASADLAQPLGDGTLGDALLAPTRIYVKPLLALFEQARPLALAHITGGGLTENLPRVLPDGLGVELDAAAWPRPEVFNWLQREGGIADEEMWRTFNCGIGMCLVLRSDDTAAARAVLEAHGEAVYDIGRVVARSGVHIA